MSPFDLKALAILLDSFGRRDLLCLEIGSWFGAGSTQVIAEYSKKIICVDHWRGNDNHQHKKIVAEIDVFSRFKQNTKRFGELIIPIQGNSTSVCQILRKRVFDFIFIDGDHRYEGTRNDILKSKPLLKNGGILAGHDCEGSVTSENRAIILNHLNEDHIDSIFEGFSQCHPGVIFAVDETINHANLFAKKLITIENQRGFSTIWWKKRNKLFGFV